MVSHVATLRILMSESQLTVNVVQITQGASHGVLPSDGNGGKNDRPKNHQSLRVNLILFENNSSRCIPLAI